MLLVLVPSGWLGCGSGDGRHSHPFVTGTGGTTLHLDGATTAAGDAGGAGVDARDAATLPRALDGASTSTSETAAVPDQDSGPADVPLGQDGMGGSDASAEAIPAPQDAPARVGEDARAATDAAACTFTVITNVLSPLMPTVGIVEWSTDLPDLQRARIVYDLRNATPSVLNRGGVAPVDLDKPNRRTLLLGLKPGSDYAFHIEATGSEGTCSSPEYSLPRTGVLPFVPAVTRIASNAVAQAKGFIVTSGGMLGAGAYIIDADGTVVWAATAPQECSRARMDFEGENLWMLRANAANTNGEMRFLSMDGMTGRTNVSGLASAHHDFTVVPGKIVALAWATTGTDVESNLVEQAADGSGAATTLFKIGSNLYQGSATGAGRLTYHCNSILYHPGDDTFTIGDRYPSLYVKVRRDGTPLWQIGGSCTNAQAPKCAQGTWTVNHGHDFAPQGNMLIFNNNDERTGSRVLELAVTESDTSIAIAEVAKYIPGPSSTVLGDVQRLPNGNTLATFSTGGQIIEADADWNTVQTLKGNFGYADWRETLYGPPAR